MREATKAEQALMSKDLMIFYSKELVSSGLAKNLDEALWVAVKDCQSPDQERKFYHYKIERRGKEAGFCVYSVKDRTAKLEFLYLHRQFQGKGLGTKALEQFQAQLTSVDKINLYVFSCEPHAFKFYQKMGFSVDKEDVHQGKTIGYAMKKNLIYSR